MDNNYTILLEKIIGKISDLNIDFKDRMQIILNDLANYYGYEYGIIEVFNNPSESKLLYSNYNFQQLEEVIKENFHQEFNLLQPFINNIEYVCNDVTKLENNNLDLNIKSFIAATFNNPKVSKHKSAWEYIRISFLSNSFKKKISSNELFLICNFVLGQVYSFLSETERESKIMAVGNWKYNIINKELVWSPELLSIFGYAWNDKVPSVGEYIKNIYPEDLPTWIKNVVLSINAGIPYDLKFRVYSKNKKDLIYVRTITEIVRDKNNNVIEILGTVYDYSNYEKQNRVLESNSDVGQNNVLDTSNNDSKWEFLANVSHEIRNPLNAVIGATELLKENRTIATESREYLEIISDASNRMLTLINQILDYAKIENSQIELQISSFNLYEEIVSIINIYHFMAREKGLEIRLDYDVINLPKFFTGDCNKIGQIIQNLLNNAIKFTHKGYVEIKVQALEYLNDKAKIAIFVKDTGIGIEASKQQVIFDKFVQANNQIIKKYGGTGLGLSISKNLAALMNGTIELTSTPNIGSSFKFTLELGLVDNKFGLIKKNECKIDIDNAKARILVVEDEIDNQIIILSILKQLNYHVLICRLGSEAIQLLKQYQVDLVLMDCNLPVMDGFITTSIIQEMTKNNQIKNLPVIAITGYSSKLLKEKCLEAGMCDYIIKPLNKEELLTKVATWLSKKKITFGCKV